VHGGFAGMSAFVTAPGAYHYRLQFLEVVNTYANTDVVKLAPRTRPRRHAELTNQDAIITPTAAYPLRSVDDVARSDGYYRTRDFVCGTADSRQP
jgi:hypothetical protein